MMATNENAPIESLIKSFMFLLLTVVFIENQQRVADYFAAETFDVHQGVNEKLFKISAVIKLGTVIDLTKLICFLFQA
jgi:hypothetical protein